ncbi:hypothetical protein JCM6882_005895 [Rhodosporidiobolus microsporus]
MSQPPYPPPPGNGYPPPPSAYGQGGYNAAPSPLLSTGPLNSSSSSGGFDPYGGGYAPPHLNPYHQHHQPQQRIPSGGGYLPPMAPGQPPLQQQQQQQQQPGLPPPLPPPGARPSSALADGGVSVLAQPPQRIGTPSSSSYGLPPPPLSADAGSAAGSPALSVRAPPTPTGVGGVGGMSGSPLQQQQHLGGGGGVGGGGNGAAGGAAPGVQMPKARSAMACVLCRRQKMKCEGPEKAPCRRCRAAQVECVFEAPPAAPPRPRGGGVSEAWVESRLNQVEQRVSSLEESSSSSLALVTRQQHQQNGSVASAAAVSDHERRIAALEAQLYALQLAASRPPPPPLQQQQPPQGLPSMFSSPSVAHGMSAFDSSGGGAAAGGGGYGYSAPNPYAGGAPSSASGSLKHEPDTASLDGGADGTAGAAGGADAHREKRWKGDPLLPTTGLGGNIGASAGVEEPDFIARGMVTEEEAAMCFNSYHLTFETSSSSSAFALPQTHISFEETRRRSPLFLATVISIGARSLSRFDTFHATYREAMRLAHLTFLPYADGGEDLTQLDPSSPPSRSYIPFVPFGAPGSDAADAPKPRLSTLSLKALMLLALYHSMPELLVHVWMLGGRFIMPTALLEFERLSKEEKATKAGRELVNKGRVFLTGYLWLAFYTYCRGQQGYFEQPIEVLRHQLDVVRRSAYAENPTDQVIRINLEECLILLNAFKQLGPGMRTHQLAQNPGGDHAELYRLVGEAIDRLVEWDKEYHDGMETLSQWGDSRELKSIIPFAHGRQCLLLYIFRDIPFAEIDRDSPKTREFARMGRESALHILRWGVESRIWMPFSVVGNYVHHVNVPSSLFLLNTVSRLYPSDTDFSSVRPLLHRLTKQCDVTITHAGATPREIARARRTKMEVLELDRFAFEQGEEGVGAGGGEGGMGGGAGGAGMFDGPPARTTSAASSNGGDGASDEPGLFGQEITASLDSLRLELNLWAKPLRAFEEDI